MLGGSLPVHRLKLPSCRHTPAAPWCTLHHTGTSCVSSGGGAMCTTSADCGNFGSGVYGGDCIAGKCVCKPGYTCGKCQSKGTAAVMGALTTSSEPLLLPCKPMRALVWHRNGLSDGVWWRVVPSRLRLLHRGHTHWNLPRRDVDIRGHLCMRQLVWLSIV